LSPLAAALLGIVQGLTEFLPVSSSAHLIIARDLFGVRLNESLDMAFDVACHVGTLLAVVAFFRAEIVAMLRALPRVFRPAPDLDARRIRLIVVGTIPIVIVGALGGGALEETLRTPAVAAASLSLGALLLFAAERVPARPRPETELTTRDAILVGVAQALALIPGVSRSGVTIGTGMLLGYRRADIARFTFLLSIPAILAAAAKKGLELRHLTLSGEERHMFSVDVTIGIAASAIVGYLAIRFFIGYLANHRLDVFAWYRLALAAVLVALLIWR
jgi:undecaprenyl-diphosphatase